MSVVYSSHALKHSEGDLVRNQEMGDSNISDPQQHCHHQHNYNYNSGLMRHCSAPSPMLTNLVMDTITINHDDDEDHHHHHHYLPTTSSEMETMLAKLISPTTNNNNNNMLSNLEPLQGYGGGRVVKKEEEEEEEGDKGSYNFGSNNNESHMLYQHHHHHDQIQGLPNGSMNGFDGSFNAVNSMALENNTQPKMGSANCSNLIRQKSSPAGFFSNYSLDNAFRGCDVSNGQATTSTSSGIHGTLKNFTTRPSYCNMSMPLIVESGNEGIEPNCVERNDIDNGSNKSYMQNFTTDFWDSSAFNGSKTASGSHEIMFSTSKNALEAQDADFGYQKLGLTHHLSLPSSSTKMGGMDKLFQIQGSVPCKIRAKRGFATHPRSIAERERRTRISERIKKLQDLFPKSDKQTSTADMLDLAVEYIKDLQKQVKILKDNRAKCTCSSNQKQ